MSKFRIIGKITLSEIQYNRLLKLGLEHKHIARDNPISRNNTDEIVRRIGDAEAIIINISTPITREVIERCSNLRFIQTWSAGTDNIDIVAANEHGIIVKNDPDFSIESVAEKTLAMMIFIANQLKEANIDAESGAWNYIKFQGIELKGKTLCIVGKGRIGSRIAELATVFGMDIIFSNSRTIIEELHCMFSISDFITVNCPLTKKTTNLIGEKEFSVMKKGVYFINNARGGIVDEEALINALDSGIVRYASVDVLKTEPPEFNNKLVKHPNVFVTPHIAWNTKESVERLSDTCIKNLEDFLFSSECIV
jgi:phosphoglycerate dehydrogenase-like enzyme